MAASWKAVVADTAADAASANQLMLGYHKDYRQQIEAKGYVTFEAEVTDEEKENAAATGPRGRRRFRPGVMKKHGVGIKKLN